MNYLKWLVPIGLCAWLGQYVLAMFVPTVIMETLYRKAGAVNGFNQLVLSPIPDETSRGVVRPSPDLFYAICVYNLEDGPLTVEAPVPKRYWSMQFYQMNTDNFAGITNQRDEQSRVGSTVRVTLISADDNPADYEGELIQSPTERGVMLLRASAIGDNSASLAALRGSRCGASADAQARE